MSRLCSKRVHAQGRECGKQLGASPTGAAGERRRGEAHKRERRASVGRTRHANMSCFEALLPVYDTFMSLRAQAYRQSLHLRRRYAASLGGSKAAGLR